MGTNETNEPTHFTKSGTRKYQTNGPQEWTAGLVELADMVGSPHIGVAINIVMDWAMERLEQVKDDVRTRLEMDRKYAERQREAGPGKKRKGKGEGAPVPEMKKTDSAKGKRRKASVVSGPQMVLEEVPE